MISNNRLLEKRPLDILYYYSILQYCIYYIIIVLDHESVYIYMYIYIMRPTLGNYFEVGVGYGICF